MKSMHSMIDKFDRQFCRRACFFVPQLIVMVVLISTQSGCQMFDQFRGRAGQNAPVVFSEAPTKEQLIAQLVSQTENVRQLQTDVKVSIDGLPNLRGNLVVEKPNRLRLNAGLLGVTELGIDVGSNDDVFWFWAKAASAGAEPGIYYARHAEYQNSPLQNTIPIEPSWLIDALGLIQFDPGSRIDGPFTRPQDGRLELHTYKMVGSQLTLRKTVVDPQYGWVIQQAIYDAGGKLLAYANSEKHEHYPEHNVSLPGRVVITAVNPDGSKLSLAINASRFKINSIYGDPNQLWSMPNPGDIPMINIVQGVSNPNQSNINLSADPSPRHRGHRTSSNVLTQTETFLNNIR